jgi:hypothetical protein
MFNFTSIQEGDKTFAVLGDYSVRFFANSRNTRITAAVGANDECDEYRATGTIFYHYDAADQGHSHCDTGGRQFDNSVFM